MNLKEHLQFLAMMVPTLLLLAALLVSIAYPAQGIEADRVRPAFSETIAVAEVSFADDNDIWPAGPAPR
jgi:O-antigen ligase